jgi:hypothetical protein
MLMKDSFAVLIVAELEMQEGVRWVLDQDAEVWIFTCSMDMFTDLVQVDTKDNVHSVSGCSTRPTSQ